MANYVSKFNLLGEDILVRDTAATTEINNVTEKVDELENKVNTTYPNQTDHENYKTDVLNNLVSYLRRNNFSSCFASGSAIGNNVLEYQQGQGYMGLLGAGTFNTSDTRTVGSTQYRVQYYDCSMFTSLITKCRSYETSPYGLAYENNVTNQQTLKMAALENPDPNKPYTFDAMNNIATENFAKIMNASGNTLTAIAKMPGQTIDMDALNRMDTGDIVFLGSSSHRPTQYGGIYHCGVYVKTLDELNTVAQPYGVKFKPIDSETQDLGIVVHFWSDGSNDYTDNLVIHTLRYLCTHTIRGTDQTVWMCPSYANSLNSNKQGSEITGFVQLYDTIEMINPTKTGELSFPDYGVSIYRAVTGGVKGGMALPLQNVNIDNLVLAGDSGLYKTYNATQRDSVTGTFPSDLASGSFYFLEIWGSDSGRGAIQKLYVVTRAAGANTICWIRGTGSSDTSYGPWVPLNLNFQRGSVNSISVSANSVYTGNVTYPRPMGFIAPVLLTPYIDSASDNYGSVTLAVSGNTSTGFEYKIYNNTSGKAAVSFFWMVF